MCTDGISGYSVVRPLSTFGSDARLRAFWNFCLFERPDEGERFRALAGPAHCYPDHPPVSVAEALEFLDSRPHDVGLCRPVAVYVAPVALGARNTASEL